MAGPRHQGCSGKKSCLLEFTVREVLRNVSILWRLGKKGSQEEQGPVVWTSLEAKWEGRDGEEESWEGRGTDEGGGKPGTEQGFVSVQSPAFFFPPHLFRSRVKVQLVRFTSITIATPGRGFVEHS